METLRLIALLLHISGFVILLGAWLVQAFGKRRITRLQQIGMTISAVTGIALSFPWGTDVSLDYVKLGVKLVVLLAIDALLGIGGAKQRRNERVAPAIFWLIGVLTVADAAIAVLWR